ncbi:MAG: helix-turn-helix domain-containing protein [Coriobacteriales bacterium]
MNLRAERVRMGMTAEEVGKRVGRSARSILMYERGAADPPGTVLVKLSRLYKKDPDYLLDMTEQDCTQDSR